MLLYYFKGMCKNLINQCFNSIPGYYLTLGRVTWQHFSYYILSLVAQGTNGDDNCHFLVLICDLYI